MNISPFSRRAALYRQRLLAIALACIACVVMPLGYFAGVPAAGIALGLIMLTLAGCRLVCSVETLGALVVRQRAIDVCILTLLGLILIGLSLTSPNL